MCKLCKLPPQSLDLHPKTRLKGEIFYHLNPPTPTIGHNFSTVMLLIRRPGKKIGRPPNRPSTLHLMFGWWSQHAHHNLETCSSQARNMYNMSGEEGEGRNMEKVFATWEKLFATWKSVRDIMFGY
jgi:hypothetical protein